MNKTEFISSFKELLHTDVDLNENSVLANLADWDSLAVMVVMDFIEQKFDVCLTINEIWKCNTLADLMQKADITN